MALHIVISVAGKDVKIAIWNGQQIQFILSLPNNQDNQGLAVSHAENVTFSLLDSSHHYCRHVFC